MSNRINLLRVLSRVFDNNVDYQQIESLIGHDATLSFKLLRIINSAAYSGAVKIKSLKQGLVYLGLKNLRSWVGLLVLSGFTEDNQESLKVSCIRAKMCKNVA